MKIPKCLMGKTWPIVVISIILFLPFLTLSFYCCYRGSTILFNDADRYIDIACICVSVSLAWEGLCVICKKTFDKIFKEK